MPKTVPTPTTGPLAPFDERHDGPWDRARVAHLMRRAGFGPRPGDLDRFVRAGFPVTINRLSRGRFRGTDVAALEWVDEPTPLPRDFATLTREERRERGKEARRRAFELETWWLRRMLDSPDPLREKMALFWHAHVFPSSAEKVRSPRHLYLQNTLFREHAFDRYADLLAAVARDPAMLIYLDNRQNRKGRPNENFARELMELFTIGIGHYSETDVHEAARAFTGWTLRGDQFLHADRLHDDGAKQILGRRGDLDGDDVIKVLAAHAATADRLADRLARFFVSDAPAAGLVQALADRLRSTSLDVGDAVRVLLRSRTFHAPEVRFARVRGPVELAVSTVRALDAEIPDPLLARATDRMGQRLFHPPNVKGWEDGLRWVDASALFARYNALTAFVVAPSARRGRARPRERDRATAPPRIDLKALGLMEGAPDAVAGRIGDLLFGEPIPGPVADEVVRLLRDADTADVARDRAVRGALALAVASPQYQVG